jgi:hypothetical protein
MADLFTRKIKSVRFAMAVEFSGRSMQSAYNGQYDMSVEFIKGTKGCILLRNTKTNAECMVLDNNIAYILLEIEQ